MKARVSEEEEQEEEDIDQHRALSSIVVVCVLLRCSRIPENPSRDSPSRNFHFDDRTRVQTHSDRADTMQSMQSGIFSERVPERKDTRATESRKTALVKIPSSSLVVSLSLLIAPRFYPRFQPMQREDFLLCSSPFFYFGKEGNRIYHIVCRSMIAAKRNILFS